MSSEITSTASGPLAGVKVVDFGWAIAGALTGKFLADMGAEVIRVESGKNLDLTRRDRRIRRSTESPDDKPFFAHLNSSKMAVTLDLKNPRSREVLDRLFGWADVVNENFTPGTMARLGLSYEHIRERRPDIVYMSSSMFGQTGPLALGWGVDGTGAAVSGRLGLTGWADRVPITPGSAVYGDYVMPLVAASGIVAALIRRGRTGVGEYLETSMFEVTAQQVLPTVLDFEHNARSGVRTGNRSAHAAPHGVFPVLGADRWCAITALTEGEWQALTAVVGHPEWVTDRRFSTLEARKQNEDELEALIGEWTRRHSAEQIMQLMQSAGVAAGVVHDPETLVDRDPQFAHREHLVAVDHPLLDAFGHQRTPVGMSATPPVVRQAPRLGEHNEFVCCDVLGMSEEEFIMLQLDDVFV